MKPRRFRFCIWEQATGNVVESAAVYSLPTWAGGEGRTLRIRGPLPADYAALPDVESSAAPIPDAGGLIDPATGDVVRMGPASIDERRLALADEMTLEEARQRVVRLMRQIAARYLFDLRRRFGLYTLTPGGSIIPDAVLQRFANKEAQLAGHIAAAQAAADKNELRSAYQSLKGATGE